MTLPAVVLTHPFIIFTPARPLSSSVSTVPTLFTNLENYTAFFVISSWNSCFSFISSLSILYLYSSLPRLFLLALVCLNLGNYFLVSLPRRNCFAFSRPCSDPTSALSARNPNDDIPPDHGGFITQLIASKMLLESVPLRDFSEHFRLGRRLGDGSFSEVFEASRRSESDHLLSDRDIPPRTYAVKRIDRNTITSGAERRVCTEVSILNDLRHPNVVEIFQYFHIVLELLRGGELFDKIVQKIYHNEDGAREISRSILTALQYIHHQGVVHRDLKPENLLLSDDNDYSVKIADFGFAFDVRKGLSLDNFGTARYKAPEIFLGIPYGKSVDMWSTGVIIYVVLCGYAPFSDRNQTRLYAKIRDDDKTFDERYWRHVSAETKDLIWKLLDKNPANRLTVAEALNHPWLQTSAEILSQNDLSASLDKLRWFNATQKLRAAVRRVLPARTFERNCARSTAA